MGGWVGGVFFSSFLVREIQDASHVLPCTLALKLYCGLGCHLIGLYIAIRIEVGDYGLRRRRRLYLRFWVS